MKALCRYPIRAERLLGCRKGQALVETALVLPLLLLLLLGLIESGNGLAIKHKMVVLSREGANLASRGTSMAETLDVVMDEGSEIALAMHGGAVLTKITVVHGNPVVDARVSYPGLESSSRLGEVDEVVGSLQDLDLSDGQVLYALEIIYRYQALTPVAGFLPDGWLDEIYERAIF